MDVVEQESIFRRWLTEHAGLMWKAVRAFAATAEDAEDLFQEMALHLWMSLPAFRGEAKESTWIYRVAFNTALVWQRGEKRRQAKHVNFAKLNLQSDAITNPHGLIPNDELVASVLRDPAVAETRCVSGIDAARWLELSRNERRVGDFGKPCRCETQSYPCPTGREPERSTP